jgi:hypothetical protein
MWTRKVTIIFLNAEVVHSQAIRPQHSFPNYLISYTFAFNHKYTVQKEQGVRLVSLMQREIIFYMASAICLSSY